MNKTIPGTISLLIGAAIWISTCGNGSQDHSMHQKEMDSSMHHETMNRETRILELAGAKVTVDWMSMGQHHKMMDMMKMKGHDEHMKDSDRHLMLTVLDKESNELLREAEVTIKVFGPEGQELQVSHAQMSNEKMHHDGFSFATSGKGQYRAEITVKNGDRKGSEEVSFELE